MNRITKWLSVFLVGSIFLTAPACGQKVSKGLEKYEKQLSSITLSSSDDTLYYATGYNIESDMTKFFSKNELDFEGNIDVFLKGFIDALKKKTQTFDGASSREYLNTSIQKIQEKISTMRLEEATKFFETNKAKEGVKELPNGKGIQYIILKSGSGAQPTLQDEVECHYVGTLLDGTEFDNSVKRGTPAKFPLNGVIEGWQIALAQMKEGDKWQIFIPSDLGYGARGAGGSIPPNSTLVFEVELIKVHKKK